MVEVEKPFSCPEENCDMTFTNEDHLQVHKRRHEIQITMNTHSNMSSSAVMKHSGYLIDQTPTPTRFLKQCDEITLFQEINLNPFDYEFRKAAQFRTQLSITENHGINNGSLETPRIWPHVESDETISSTSHDDINATNANLFPSSHSSSVEHPISSRIVVMQNDVAEKKEGRKKLTLNVGTPAESGESSNIISTPTPVITAGPSVSQALSSYGCCSPTLNTPNILATQPPQILLNDVKLTTPGISPSIHLPSVPMNALQHSSYLDSVNQEDRLKAHSTSSCIQMATSAANKKSSVDSEPSPSATVLQLVLRLPNGQSIPVEFPATPLVSTISSTKTTSIAQMSIAPSYQTSAYTSVISNPVQSLAKMKLKEALASSSTAARPGVTKHSRATTADRIAEMTRTRNESGTSSNGGDNQDDSSSSSSNGTSKCKGMRRRRSSNPDETPEEKRRKFLERNRAAAVRCREKKKRLVQIIAAKSDELSIVNQKLLNEVSSLRSEVASLKCLLLRHKNCPVTLAMKGEHDSTSVYEQYPQTFTTFKVQDPSGIITEETTPIICSHQPSASIPRNVTFTPTINSPCTTSKSYFSNDKFINEKFCNVNSFEQSLQISQSKLRKRSLSLSAISLTNTCPTYSARPEVELKPILANSLQLKHAVNKVGHPSDLLNSFITNDNSKLHTASKVKSLQRIFVTTTKKSQ